MKTHIETVLRIHPLGQIDVQDFTCVCEDDGTLIAKSKAEAYGIAPGDDASDRNDRVKDAVAFYQTAEVIAAYQALLIPPQ